MPEPEEITADLTGIHEPADWDYDSLAATFGEDDTTEVDS